MRGNEVVGRKVTHLLPNEKDDVEERMTTMEKVLGLVHDSSGTDGVTVMVKAKVAENLGQVVAMCVVFSFNEQLFHSDKQTL